MKRILLATFSLLLLMPPVASAPDIANLPFSFDRAGPPATEVQSPPRLAMWRLETAETKITFLGSYHILPPGLSWQDEHIAESLHDADVVLFESDERETEKPEFLGQVMTHARLPDGQSLDQLLSPEQFSQINEICMQLGVPFGAIADFKLWFASIVLAVQHAMQMGAFPEHGVDAVLEAQARSAGKVVEYLETPQQVLEALLAMDTMSITN